MYCLSLYIETCMEPVCLVFKPVWNLEVLSCLVLSCLTPDFCLALICLDFVYLYKRGVLYAQTVLAQILSFAIIPLTRPQVAPNVTPCLDCSHSLSMTRCAHVQTHIHG